MYIICMEISCMHNIEDYDPLTQISYYNIKCIKTLSLLHFEYEVSYISQTKRPIQPNSSTHCHHYDMETRTENILNILC